MRADVRCVFGDFPGDNCRISVSDWDGDGHSDLILISWVNISLYRNHAGKPVLFDDTALSQIEGLKVRVPSYVDYLPLSCIIFLFLGLRYAYPDLFHIL